MKKNKANSERALFFSLWGIVFLFVGIWKFWPTPGNSAEFLPPLTIGAELRTLFEDGATTKASPTFFTAQLRLTKQYRELLSGDEKRIHVGYRLLHEDSVLSEGVVPCLIRPQDSTVTLTLQNPERVYPKNIQLYLSH